MFGRIGFLPIVCLVSLWGGLHPALAQVDSALEGKIVHVYLPSDDVDTLFLRNWSIPARKSGRYWHTVTLIGDKFNSNQGFFFATPLSTRFLTKSGFGPVEGVGNRFAVGDFAGRQEMWIVVDPSGPLTAAPVILLDPPKIVNILNPWPTTAPRIALAGGTYKPMVARPDHCGWFMAFLLKPSEMPLHLQEISGTDVYGAGGLGSASPYDMAALFAAKGEPDTLGMELWLDTDLNRWLSAHPGKEGSCQYLMAATVRDFSEAHPDFDFGNIVGEYPALGRVQTTLGADRRPVRSTVSSTVNDLNIFNDFESWWRTDSTNATPALRSYETCVDIPNSKTGDGLWEYDSYPTPSHGFWPIDNFTNPNNSRLKSSCYNHPDSPSQWVTGGPATNMNFCMESHAAFIYLPGQKFIFRADDDLWVFINDKLVVDQGGLHAPQADTVDLDILGLTAGREYKWDLFHCERQPCVSSLRIKTSIYFRQQRALDMVQVPGSGAVPSYRIIRRVGGNGSCAGLGDSLKEVPASGLTYLLWNSKGEALDTLAEGSQYGGGIVIATPLVTVDTSKLSGSLPLGTYSVLAYEPADARIRVQIPFAIGQPSTRIRSASHPRLLAPKPPLHDALGRTRKDHGGSGIRLPGRE